MWTSEFSTAYNANSAANNRKYIVTNRVNCEDVVERLQLVLNARATIYT